MLRRNFLIAVAVSALASVPLTALSADDEQAEAEIDPVLAGRSCIDAEHITRIEVQDDATIDFRLRGGKIMRNVLPKECRQLWATGTFEYRTTRQHLCEDSEIYFRPRNAMRSSMVRCDLGSFTELEPRID